MAKKRKKRGPMQTEREFFSRNIFYIPHYSPLFNFPLRSLVPGYRYLRLMLTDVLALRSENFMFISSTNCIKIPHLAQ